MARPPERAPAERVRRALADGRRPLELWADAHDRGDLETGLLLGARFEQARCHQLAGDVLAAAGDREPAREHYDRAIARFDQADFGARHHERVRDERRALG